MDVWKKEQRKKRGGDKESGGERLLGMDPVEKDQQLILKVV